MVNAIDRYFARPDNEVFNSMTLAEFASEFRVIASSYKGMADVDDTPEESCLATTNSKNKTQENSAISKSNKTYQFANGLGTLKEDKTLLLYATLDSIETRVRNYITALS